MEMKETALEKEELERATRHERRIRKGYTESLTSISPAGAATVRWNLSVSTASTF